MRDTCEVIERIDQWPYVWKCREPALFVTDVNYDGEFSRMRICEEHADAFKTALPHRRVEKIEEIQTDPGA